jgi:phage gp29-like protein|nr:MAG TPA: Portal protein [Caudoviricetes sp.]
MSNDSKEIGRVGQRRYGGIFYEEFLSELRGRKGAEVFTEMSNNDETIGAILFAIEMLVRQASWNVEPGGSTAKDREAAEFVKSCMDDMQQTWIDTISEILSFLTYGWSFHEIVYKRRMGRTKDNRTSSKYDDGLIGWMKLPIRSQETLYQWEYDDQDNLIGMTQMPPPDFGLITIPMNKAMLFRTRSRKDNPEGRSILRTAYRSWYFKRRIQEIEGIGIERDLAGLPVITTPEGMDIWDKDDEDMNAIRTGLEAMVKNIRRDSTEGLVLPFGYTFELTSTGGSRQFDTNSIIARYDTKISQTVLADFIQLGHESVGSFALSSDKTNLFSMAICAFLDIICQTFNSQGIPALIDINGDHFAGVTDYPRLTHGDIEDVDLATVATFIKDMTSIGVIIPDESLEDYVRQLGKLPKRTTDTIPMEARRAAQQQGNEPPEPETAAGKGHDGEEGFEDNGSHVSAARKRLGRE